MFQACQWSIILVMQIVNIINSDLVKFAKPIVIFVVHKTIVNLVTIQY